MPDTVDDRPLKRTATHVLMRELLRREDHAAWRKLLVEMPLTLLLDEVRRRQAVPRVVQPLRKKWPTLADDDLPFDGDVRDE